MKKILVIGRHPQIMENVLGQLNRSTNWQAEAVLTDEAARETFVQTQFDLVLFGGGVETNSVRILSNDFKNANPEVQIIQHFGGGPGKLMKTIENVMKK